MSIHIKHPTYIEFLKNERDTLSFLSKNTTVNKLFPQLAYDAELAYYNYVGVKPADLGRKGFDFHSSFNISIEKAERRIILESKVDPNFAGIVSYVLSICELSQNPYNLLRKFHFDFALPVQNDPWPKPVYHLQYGGDQSPGLTNLNLEAKVLHSWLSSPRLNYVPMNLALLLDTVFIEFRSIDTNTLIESDAWRQLVKKNEDKLLKPFYENMKEFLNTGYKTETLIRDYCYGRC